MRHILDKIDCWVLTGGAGPNIKQISGLPKPKLAIAADSGLELARKLKQPVDFAVGDFDSLRRKKLLKALPPQRIHRYERDKDYTDTQLALRLAKQQGARCIALLGGGEGRCDHFLANFSLLASEEAPALWQTAYERIIPFTGRLELCGPTDMTVSIFPLKLPVVIESAGLHWPVDTVDWQNQASLSNRLTNGRAQLQAIKGAAAVILPC